MMLMSQYEPKYKMNNEFSQTLSLLKSGAKWGDIEVYTLEENEEILRIKIMKLSNVPVPTKNLRVFTKVKMNNIK